MTNGLSTAKVIFFCQMSTQSHLDAILPGTFQNMKLDALPETERCILPPPSGAMK